MPSTFIFSEKGQKRKSMNDLILNLVKFIVRVAITLGATAMILAIIGTLLPQLHRATMFVVCGIVFLSTTVLVCRYS